MSLRLALYNLESIRKYETPFKLKNHEALDTSFNKKSSAIFAWQEIVS